MKTGKDRTGLYIMVILILLNVWWIIGILMELKQDNIQMIQQIELLNKNVIELQMEEK